MLKEFIAKLEKEVQNRSIYVWGGQGEKASEEIIERKESEAKNQKRALKLYNARKAKYKNMRVFDCSGLVTKLWGEVGAQKKTFDTTANGLMKNYCKTITKAQLMPGDLVFRKYNSGKAYHVGVVVDFDGNVIEAKGRDDGVVKRALTASRNYWNAYGRPECMREEIEAQERPYGFVLYRNLKRTLPNMKGEDVKAVQTALVRSGYIVSIDGAYGKSTAAAVKKFQKAKGLEADGIVGRSTTAALGGTYK